MSTTAFLHPELSGKTPEEIAASLAAPGTPEYSVHLEKISEDGTPERQALFVRYFDAYVARCRKFADASTRKILTSDKIAQWIEETRLHWLWAATIYEFGITEEHVKDIRYRYGADWLLDGKSWPTGWWFRFAQKEWEKRRWHMVPAFPASMLALAGYKLATSWRYMGDLTDEERGTFVRLQGKHEEKGKDALSVDEKTRITDLLGEMPYGGELPILDIDVAEATKGPSGEDLTPELADQIRESRGREAVNHALAVTEIWRRITGVTPRWTVTNTRGGLHGLNLPLQPHVRHPDLLRTLMEEMTKLLPTYKVPFMVKGDQSESSGPVKLDLTAYNKHAAGRGGMWRLPFCSKDKPGSLPQTPVKEYAS